MKWFFQIMAAFSALFSLVCSCSTTRVLADGQYRLTESSVRVTNGDMFRESGMEMYIKQKPAPWSPMLWVYNWSGREGKSAMSRLVRKFGTAPTIYDPEMVDKSVENISRHLIYTGYYGSKVVPDIKVRRKKVRVEYVITLGKRFRISDIKYVLPETSPEFAEDFLRDTASVTVKRGDYLSEAALEAETVRSSAHLRKMGYYDFSKNHYFFEADTLKDPGKAALELRINEYTRNETQNEAAPLRKYTFGQVNIYYPESLNIREKVLTELNTVIPGRMYSESDVNNTYSRLSALRVFSSVNIELSRRDSGKVDCNINLTPARYQGFKLKLEGSSNSTGLFGISPELSFYHKNIFRGGEWMNLSFMGNFQFRPNDNVRSTEFGVSSGFSFPKFLFLPYRHFKGAIPRTDLKLSYNYQDRPEYTRNIISTSFGYTGFHKNLYYQFYPLQINIVRLFNMDASFYSSLSGNPFMKNAYRDHFDLGSGATLYYTTNSDANPKTSYKYALFQVNVAGNLLSAFKPLMGRNGEGSGIIWNTPYSQYVRAELSLGRTWRLGSREQSAIATRFLVGAGHAYGNSKVLPFEQHFYGGGSNSLRGWQARSVGPGLSKADPTFVIPNQTGDMRLEANLEYRFRMFWKLDGALFLDAGNVWTLHEASSVDANYELGRLKAENFIGSIAADWGAGVRLDLNFILIRFDLGMQLHNPAMDAGQRWIKPRQWLAKDRFAFHFGVGYPF